ncbi:hypothetical protein BGW38_006006 [Lunasporangiospora selenospora]|uniref:Uncharacterized protein n=1 Tax=Lunasporangiospora selenospora TaxID=979761 RepID=A0A9P6FMA9_9FUNG|nr:hypothetical protein BGW38_006006 [Lunasporangiospora selenospora]
MLRSLRPQPRPGLASSTSTSPRHFSISSLFSLSSFVALAILFASFPSHNYVLAQAKETIALSLLGQDGSVIGTPQVIERAICSMIDISSVPEGTVYASVSAAVKQSGFNLYSDGACQLFAKTAVGQWSQAAVPGVLRVRWEGPSSATVGTLGDVPFPPNMAGQTLVPEAKIVWKLDPSKGKTVVGLVAAVLVIGIAIGVYQVYRVAQYKPPPKQPKKPKLGTNVKKIKKKDAYYKKPVRADQQAFQRLHNESPEPSMSSLRSTQPMGQRPLPMQHNQSSLPQLPMIERSRDSQYSEGASTFVNWNERPTMNTNKGSGTGSGSSRLGNGRDSVSIDMRGALTPDLIQLDGQDPHHHNHHGHNHSNSNNSNNSGYANPANYFSSNNNSSYNYNNNNNSNNNGYQRGRGGEVMVPMHNLDSSGYQSSTHQYGQGRATRRSSSSRSR